ncbi:MAG: hypothetical protein CVT48_05825 [Thermoplasmata archaeon HGW-Thermoplasmata-1]|nr:MAG: hypothetical protein CVT48_05825 [Thermoplasmata archaeon HGW-Thermoplasmata-1]
MEGMDYAFMGAKGSIVDAGAFVERVNRFALENRIAVQFMNARMVYGKEHLLSALVHAVRSLEQGRNSASSPALEMLLYACGEKQISAALGKMGVISGEVGLAACFASVPGMAGCDGHMPTESELVNFIEKLGLRRDDAVMKGTPEKLFALGISAQEAATVGVKRYVDLVLEKVAMTDILQ